MQVDTDSNICVEDYQTDIPCHICFHWFLFLLFFINVHSLFVNIACLVQLGQKVSGCHAYNDATLYVITK